MAKQADCGSMKPTLHKAAARKLLTSPALHATETGDKPDFQDRNMSEPKCEPLSCGMDATKQAKLVHQKVKIPTKRKRKKHPGDEAENAVTKASAAAS